MNNTEFVSALNEYSFSGENDKILKILNALFDSGEYKAYLNLVFNAISLTQMYGFLSYIYPTVLQARFAQFSDCYSRKIPLIIRRL